MHRPRLSVQPSRTRAGERHPGYVRWLFSTIPWDPYARGGGGLVRRSWPRRCPHTGPVEHVDGGCPSMTGQSPSPGASIKGATKPANSDGPTPRVVVFVAGARARVEAA